jgi:two-component system phosphate regulon response regulator PhoB
MKKTVLIVNDESVPRAALRDAFVVRGYRVVEAADGAEGLLSAARHLPDLIVLDLVMPGLDGLTVLARLQDAARTASVPVVMVEGQPGRFHREMAIELGAAEVFAAEDSAEEIAAVGENLVSARRNVSPAP